MTSDLAAIKARNKEKILQTRADALAKRQTGREHQETFEVVEFLLGGEIYAFEMPHLREVTPLTGVTYIPSSPPFVLGVINLRGQIVPIINLRAFLNIDTGSVTVFNKAIILQRAKLVIGFLADEVVGARRVPLDILQFSLPTLTGLSAQYFKAITDTRLVVLDAGKILSDPRFHAEQLV
jgi:purine-binding chemotaxis protein CheW